MTDKKKKRKRARISRDGKFQPVNNRSRHAPVRDRMARDTTHDREE